MNETHEMVLWLLAAAAVINVLSYGGTTWIHASDQRRPDPRAEQGRALDEASGQSRQELPERVG